MNLKGLVKIIFVVPVIFLFVSCNKNNEEAFEVLSDVFYINKVIDNEVQTGVAFYAFGNKLITSATATLPGGNTVQLQSNQSIWYTWFKEPDIEEYTIGYPAEGTYRFEITSKDGEVLQSSDVLEIDTLAIPVISEIEYNTGILGYEVSWDEIEKAHGFVIKIKNSEGDFVYSSFTINGQTTNYEVIEGGSGQWFENPVDGETYIFQIQAIRFDNDADQTNYVYNFGELSIGETEVVWGL